ncbi:hypothetical protein [Paenarthrobacter nitroguajacolicus]|uniref:hypothetical protein n=1 Tax=Paenarthrobacter nitroguajacolicus TaxID=211146 RepID=UPI00285EA32C|nr:hypothetical protein [Paenarthrobacter nitroguajacolicus]MDR6639796.1 hypothetical protein [Paenarthrobacter nitroguajacolicus]
MLEAESIYRSLDDSQVSTRSGLECGVSEQRLSVAIEQDSVIEKQLYDLRSGPTAHTNHESLILCLADHAPILQQCWPENDSPSVIRRLPFVGLA